jgi:hypothetical protein
MLIVPIVVIVGAVMSDAQHVGLVEGLEKVLVYIIAALVSLHLVSMDCNIEDK